MDDAPFFNSVEHAVRFLKQRGMYVGTYLVAPSYIVVSRKAEDNYETEAIRYIYTDTSMPRKYCGVTIDRSTIYKP